LHKHETKEGLLQALGQRIRSLRLAMGRTIQELAQLSELSPRFLSALEAGRGNISVARLARIAEALEQPVQYLIPVLKNDSSLRGRVWELLEQCQPEEIDELYAWLSAHQKKPRPRGIALVGVRGAGKSTIGRLLAGRLGISFVEFDAMIETAAGISLVELFNLHGEGYYRKLEHELMEKFLANSPRAVLATGGSLVTDAETWAMVRRHCHTVWLKAQARDHWSRVVAQGDIRPMGNNPSAMDELKGLLKAREPLYAQAKLVVDTSKYAAGETIELIIKGLGLESDLGRLTRLLLRAQ